jgi:phospholipid/cholesterol/gamma-HCH transport system substrate-binding protein
MAELELTIKNTVLLPEDTVASIVDSGIMGDKYVRLDVGKDTQKLLPNGRLNNTKPYRSLEDNVREFIFLSTKDDAE